MILYKMWFWIFVWMIILLPMLFYWWFPFYWWFLIWIFLIIPLYNSDQPTYTIVEKESPPNKSNKLRFV